MEEQRGRLICFRSITRLPTGGGQSEAELYQSGCRSLPYLHGCLVTAVMAAAGGQLRLLTTKDHVTLMVE